MGRVASSDSPRLERYYPGQKLAGLVVGVLKQQRTLGELIINKTYTNFEFHDFVCPLTPLSLILYELFLHFWLSIDLGPAVFKHFARLF